MSDSMAEPMHVVEVLQMRRVGDTAAPKIKQPNSIKFNLNIASISGRLVFKKPLKDASTCVTMARGANRSAQPGAAEACSPLNFMIFMKQICRIGLLPSS